MSLVNKLKNILFEEEEVEIPVIEKKEKDKKTFKNEVKEEPKKVEDSFSFYDEEDNSLDYGEKIEEPKEKAISKPTVTEEKEPENIKSFNFPSFDEEEFESSIPKRPTNVMEYEKRKTIDRELEYKKFNNFNKYERREEVKEETKAKFKPSPIISPVYGILDKNYTPDEITSRNVENSVRPLDVDSVRKKAFGVKEETKKEQKEEEFIIEEKLEKARTIDELLKDSSDEIIDLNEEKTEEIPKSKHAIDELEDIEPKHEIKEEDTLENDLFDLIDSMYENREDGE